MKSILLFFALLSTTLYASDFSQPVSSSSRAGPRVERNWWDYTIKHDDRCYTIEIFLRNAATCTLAARDKLEYVARAIPFRLILQLNGSAVKWNTSSEGLSTKPKTNFQIITEELWRFQNKLSKKPETYSERRKVERMLIVITQRSYGAIWRVEGEADPNTFATFFPPYTLTYVPAEIPAKCSAASSSGSASEDGGS